MGQPFSLDFFHLFPLLGTPGSDGLFVPLPGPSLGLLGAPSHPPEQIPDPTRMVLYFKLPLYHLGYPTKGPQIRGESGRSGPSPENLCQTLFLVSRQARGTTGMGFGAQSFYPLLLERFFPARNRGRGDADQTTHFPDSFACLEHPNGDHPAHFQSFSTPFGPHPTILPTCDR